MPGLSRETVAASEAGSGTQLFSDTTLRRLDRMTMAGAVRLSGGLSPVAASLAALDWAWHLALAPGRRMELALDAARTGLQLGAFFVEAGRGGKAAPPYSPPPGDQRFADPSWQDMPFAAFQQAFLAAEAWWMGSTADVPGIAPHDRMLVEFLTRQWLDGFSPANFLATNPVAIEAARASGGQSLQDGLRHFGEDMLERLGGPRTPPDDTFVVGRDLAITPGKVVYRNALMELIQYAPATETVKAEPILIVPAWIMKYYILDLSPANSLIRYLVSQGFTVFCISWRNVGAEDAALAFDDYRRDGVMAALDAIGKIVPGRKVHAAGYCLGGTLLSLAAAGMAEFGDDRLASLTLLAAQTDFSEAGELRVFIDDDQVASLESVMEGQGFLDAPQMTAAFQMLRANDLVWSHLVQDYLLGKRSPTIDLMAWNQDTTRMPSRMHSEYLRHFFLGNDFAAGRMVVEGREVAAQNITAPIFAVGTERDHIAPWRSVYKIHALAGSPVTFVLTNGGHNAGIVNPPGHPRRHFRHAGRQNQDPLLSADEWLAAAPLVEGSWWTLWSRWLENSGSAELSAAPGMGAPAAGLDPLCDAPGEYVRQK